MKKATWVLVVLIVVGGIYWLNKAPAKAGALDQFATCIATSGAQFYGAFWCPHCANQKAEFGSSAHLLPYIECSTPDGKSQNQVCNNAGVQGYPTWHFASGATSTGEQSLLDLSTATNCPLPPGYQQNG